MADALVVGFLMASIHTKKYSKTKILLENDVEEAMMSINIDMHK